MATDVDVRTRLKVDDQSSAALKDVATGYREASKEAEAAKENAMSFARQVAATALGTALPGLVRGAAKMATDFLKAANSAHDQEQALAGLYAVMQRMPWDESRAAAEGMRRQLLEMATEIGQAPEEVYRGYQKLLSFIGTESDESFKKAQRQTEQLTVLANVLGHNVETIAMEFGAMHDGVIRARGPLTQILKSTGIFGANMAKATTEWAKLSQAQREAKLAEALEEQASKIGKATPTITDLINTFEGMKQLFIEELGEPVIKVLVPILRDLKTTFKEMRPEIQQFARLMGVEVGQWVKAAAEKMGEAFRYLRTHGAEIKRDIIDAAKAIKEAFIFARDVFRGIVVAAKFVKGLMGKEEKYRIGLTGQVAAPAGGVPGAGGKAREAAERARAQSASEMKFLEASVRNVAGTLTATARAAGLKTGEETAGQIEGAWMALHEGNLAVAREMAQKVSDASMQGAKIASKTLTIIHNLEVEAEMIEARINAASKTVNIGELVQAWNDATAMGNRELMVMAARTLAKGKKLGAELKKSGLEITGGIDAMTGLLKEEMKNFRRDMNEMGVEMAKAGETGVQAIRRATGAPGAKAARRRRTKKAARAAAPAGGTVVNVGKMEIRQEFRDQDPDRVIFMFKKDLVKHATRRIQSRRATPFGL